MGAIDGEFGFGRCKVLWGGGLREFSVKFLCL